ncbi:hypothetical protein L1887_10421 [Cichorium endivia]|nr:hypothetical protein L1887_10421 [Cichorium endivia]
MVVKNWCLKTFSLTPMKAIEIYYHKFLQLITLIAFCRSPQILKFLITLISDSPLEFSIPKATASFSLRSHKVSVFLFAIKILKTNSMSGKYPPHYLTHII